jgi:methyl-accepting chemotaxis protein
MVENGTLDWADAVEQVDKAFPELVSSLEQLGVKGDFAIGKLVARMRELGEVSKEVQDFIKQKAEEAIGALSKYFAYLGDQQELTAEQAKNALTVMAGAFQAAVAAAGSLVGAIALLGDDFGLLLEKMRSVLGDENALLNAIQRYYNYVKANEEVLSALDALAQGFRALAQLGLVNRDNINEYAAALKDMFDEVLGSTEDQQAALAAIAPQIAMLLEAYRELGLEVPDWLAEIAAKAQEAGASLEPPEGLPDILKDIRDIMKSIAEYFGVAAENAKDLGRNVGNIPDIPDVPGGGGRGGISAQGGLHIPMVKTPTLGPIYAHHGEYVDIDKPGRGSRRGEINITLHETNNIYGADDPDKVAQHIEANRQNSMERIFRRAKGKGYI